MQVDVDVLKAIAVTAELTGAEFSEGAARVLAADLSEYPKPAVLRALERCRRELRSRMTLADVLTRITEQDGRPSADEAWALCPMSEDATAVITDEISAALAVAQPLIDAGDKIAARMAFKSAYERQVDEARQQNRPVKWWASLGHDKSGREPVIRRAVEQGRLTATQAARYLPAPEAAPEVLALACAVVGKALPNESSSATAREQLAALRKKLGVQRNEITSA